MTIGPIGTTLRSIDKGENMRDFTSESVTSGHPDKVADFIADKILDACLKKDENARVACEVALTGVKCFIFGEISLKEGIKLNYKKIARNAIAELGYAGEEFKQFEAKKVKIECGITTQSVDISAKVNDGGAGDQGIMFGYACQETPELLPMAISLAHRLAHRLEIVRKDGLIPYLLPDGKTQVTVQYDDDNKPVSVTHLVISAQHQKGISTDQIRQDLQKYVVDPIVPSSLLTNQTIYHLNSTGEFVIGGPEGDSGLTGRKNIVDTYGGYAAHGGGSFSGKDASKVDRSASYYARYLAKNVVASGIARRCEIQISYVIGEKEPLSVYINTFGTGLVDDALIAQAIKENFDLTPQGIIQQLNLKKPIYSKTTNYGHFGREHFAWEKTDQTAIFKQLLK